MGVNDTIFHILAGRVFFPCFLSLSKYQGGLGEFETVMHSKDTVEEGFLNF